LYANKDTPYAGVFYQVCIDVSPLLSGSVETLSLSVKTVLIIILYNFAILFF